MVEGVQYWETRLVTQESLLSTLIPKVLNNKLLTLWWWFIVKVLPQQLQLITILRQIGEVAHLKVQTPPQIITIQLKTRHSLRQKLWSLRSASSTIIFRTLHKIHPYHLNLRYKCNRSNSILLKSSRDRLSSRPNSKKRLLSRAYTLNNNWHNTKRSNYNSRTCKTICSTTIHQMALGDLSGWEEKAEMLIKVVERITNSRSPLTFRLHFHPTTVPV